MSHSMPALAVPDDPDMPPARAEVTKAEYPAWWRHVEHEMALVTVDALLEDDPGGQELQGIRLAVGEWDETGDFSGRALMSLSYAEGDGQRLIRSEANVGLVLLFVGPVRALPTFGAGLEYRGAGPDAGLAFLLDIGFEVAVWLPGNWQVAASIQRNFGFPSGTRNEVAFAIRYSPRRHLWWPGPEPPEEPSTAGEQE